MAGFGGIGGTVDVEVGKQYKLVVPQKLPLGGSVSGTRKPGLFKVYVPTREGATLELRTTSGTISVFGPDGNPAKDANQRPVPSGSTVKFDTRLGEFGWFGVLVDGATSYTVSSKFTITGNAKDADGSMLVPWNFYYFPFTQVAQQGTSHPTYKYDQRFGTKANEWEKTNYWKSEIRSNGQLGDGFDGHGITEQACKEYNEYCGRTVVNYEDCGWWGHCDAASCASALFAQPSASGNFSDVDLEYFATEISMRGYQIELLFFLGGLGNSNRNTPNHTEKPEDREGQALDSDIGPFHEALIKCVRQDGFPALMDLRAFWAPGGSTHSEVWNQCIYKFEMEGKQAEPDRGPQDEEPSARKIEFKTKLSANADAPPNRPNSHGNPENPAGSGWYRELLYVLHFDASGKVQHDHPKNNWKKCRWPDGDEAYAPRYIFRIKGLNPNGSGPGNPHITIGNVAQLGLVRRKLYGG